MPSNLSLKMLFVASYRSGLRLRFSICSMHTRKKGDLLHAGNAPLTVAITSLSTAWLSPDPMLPGRHVYDVESFLFLGY